MFTLSPSSLVTLPSQWPRSAWGSVRDHEEGRPARQEGALCRPTRRRTRAGRPTCAGTPAARPPDGTDQPLPALFKRLRNTQRNSTR